MQRESPDELEYENGIRQKWKAFVRDEQQSIYNLDGACCENIGSSNFLKGNSSRASAFFLRTLLHLCIYFRTSIAAICLSKQPEVEGVPFKRVLLRKILVDLCDIISNVILYTEIENNFVKEPETPINFESKINPYTCLNELTTTKILPQEVINFDSGMRIGISMAKNMNNGQKFKIKNRNIIDFGNFLSTIGKTSNFELCKRMKAFFTEKVPLKIPPEIIENNSKAIQNCRKNLFHSCVFTAVTEDKHCHGDVFGKDFKPFGFTDWRATRREFLEVNEFGEYQIVREISRIIMS